LVVADSIKFQIQKQAIGNAAGRSYYQAAFSFGEKHGVNYYHGIKDGIDAAYASRNVYEKSDQQNIAGHLDVSVHLTVFLNLSKIIKIKETI
jgi:hypothetical protein